MKKTAILIATFFNVGKFPFAPGTLASAITTGVVYLFCLFMNPGWPVLAAAAAIIFLLGIKPAAIAEKHFGHKDPHEIVIDEVSGQIISLMFLPALFTVESIGLYIAGFFIFRFFDIFKPFPVRQADQMGGGFGIMLDDVLAGLYSLGTLQLLIWLYKTVI